MKILAINGSPRDSGNTSHALSVVCDVAKTRGAEVEFFQLGGKLLYGCKACGQCRKVLNKKCNNDKDEINNLLAKMEEADAIIIGCPTYFGNVTTEVKALIDRIGYVARGNSHMLAGKLGASVVTMSHAGGCGVMDALNRFFITNNMPIVPSTYWTLATFDSSGTIDELGKKTFEKLGENIVSMLKKG